MSDRIEISICILAGHGPESLEDCLRSLRAQEGAPAFELIVGVGGHEEEGRLILRHFPQAHLVVKRRGHPGAARNALIRLARGELLLFLDDDVTVAPDLLLRLVELARRHPQVSVFGGPNGTPGRSSRFQIVQGAVLSSLVGSGPVSRRYGARHPGPADERWFTLCNLAVRRNVMLPFADELVCAEENALLTELHAHGAQMHYDPVLRVFHARRATWRGFGRQMFKYGHGRGQLLVRNVRTFRGAYVAPSLLLLYFVALGVLLATGALDGLRPWLLAPALAYAAGVLAGAGWIAVTLRRIEAVPLAVALTLVVHVCYGVGVLRGAASWPGRRGLQGPAPALRTALDE